MSSTNANVNTPPSDDGGDLSNSLGSAEVEFVSTEEKKPATTQYVVLGSLLLIAPVVIYFMYNRNGPTPAAAAAANQPSEAQQTVKTFLDNGEDGMKLMRQMLQSTEKVVKNFLNHQTPQVPLSDLKTNPFRVTKPAADDSEAAGKKKHEEERQAMLKAVGNLNLQSIMSGKRGACMINNTLYTEGQQVGQFTVEKISPGVVIVKSGQYRFELKMQK